MTAFRSLAHSLFELPINLSSELPRDRIDCTEADRYPEL